MLVLEWKERAFIEKVNSRCFCWFSAAILVHQNCAPIWRLHTKLYKDTWNVSANNSETVGHKDLRFGKIVYILVFYNTSFLKKTKQLDSVICASWHVDKAHFKYFGRSSQNYLSLLTLMIFLVAFCDGRSGHRRRVRIAVTWLRTWEKKIRASLTICKPR